LRSIVAIGATRTRGALAAAQPTVAEPARKGFAGAIVETTARRATAESFARLVALCQDAALGGAQ
jgi:hypothetical protein